MAGTGEHPDGTRQEGLVQNWSTPAFGVFGFPKDVLPDPPGEYRNLSNPIHAKLAMADVGAAVASRTVEPQAKMSERSAEVDARRATVLSYDLMSPSASIDLPTGM